MWSRILSLLMKVWERRRAMQNPTDLTNSIIGSSKYLRMQGSTANGVNSAGQIVGTYIDANGASHGWIYLP
jgi:hypothetical protein